MYDNVKSVWIDFIMVNNNGNGSKLICSPYLRLELKLTVGGL